MARNTTLANATAMLKAELSMVLDVGISNADDIPLACLLDEKQRWLCDAYDWPFLQTSWDVAAGVSARYLTIPTVDFRAATKSINFERPCRVDRWWANRWEEIEYGVGTEEYRIKNSDGGGGGSAPAGAPELLDPIQRWRFAGTTEFEIWPMPATAQTVRFTGQAVTTTLITYSYAAGPPAGSTIAPTWTATIDLDDQLVMLFAAAEKLMLQGKANAQSVLQRAQARLMQIRASYPSRDMQCSFQGRQQTSETIKRIPVKRIAVA